MNIIWLTPEVPYPPIGGRNGVYNRIVQLSKNNQIFLISIAYNKEEKAFTEEMEKYCKKVYFFDRSENKIGTLVRSVFSPYSVASRYRKDICNQIKEIINCENVDVVIVDFPNMAKNIIKLAKSSRGIVYTMNEHNVEYVRMRGMAKVSNISLIKRIAYYLESLRLEVYERNLYKSGIFSGISFFSEEDRFFFEKNIDISDAKLVTIPLGANDYGVRPLKLNNKTLLFVGRLDRIAIPNIEAIVWFVHKIWPIILESVPEAKLVIAGANPDDEIMNMSSESISIIPNFSDMKEIYDMTDCVILPLLSGGGVKGKLLEAVAFRKHIVTTNHGIEGTEFEGNKHVSLANDEESFAKSCIDILLKSTEFEKREVNAYELFKEKYDWKAIGKDYQSFLRSLVGRDK